MKKILSVLLAVAMLLTLCSFASAEGTELPEAFAHITFDGEDEGYKALTNTDKAEDSPMDGANKDIIPAEDAKFLYAAGPVNKALYIDGTYGLDLGLKPTNTDTWTVSFWVNADRLSDYGPTLQVGYNVGRAADAGNNVTWMNVTQTNWTPKYFPTIWSRNEASDSPEGNDCWPWMAPFADGGAMIGKREWAMFTIVCTGEEQIGPASGGKMVGAQLYVNGELRYDSNDNYVNGTYFNMTWDASLAPNIMKPGDSTFESLFGINYWDTIYKGYVDDLYVFDTALTADQVAALYALGDGSIESPKGGPSADAVVEEEPAPAAVEVVINGTQLGEADFSTGWWAAHSDIWAVPAGESRTAKVVGYHAAEASNWNNPNVVLQSTPTGHAPDQAEGYSEYAVVRTDNYGWGAGYDGIAQLECDWNWDTIIADTNGATFTITVTNNGDSADVVMDVVSPAGVEHHQSYKGIAVTGDLYFCFVCDGNCLDILSVE